MDNLHALEVRADLKRALGDLAGAAEDSRRCLMIEEAKKDKSIVLEEPADRKLKENSNEDNDEHSQPKFPSLEGVKVDRYTIADLGKKPNEKPGQCKEVYTIMGVIRDPKFLKKYNEYLKQRAEFSSRIQENHHAGL
jgi:hypothetical protein